MYDGKQKTYEDEFQDFISHLVLSFLAQPVCYLGEGFKACLKSFGANIS